MLVGNSSLPDAEAVTETFTSSLSRGFGFIHSQFLEGGMYPKYMNIHIRA